MKKRLVLIAFLTVAVLAAALVAVGSRATSAPATQRMAESAETVSIDGFWDGQVVFDN